MEFLAPNLLWSLPLAGLPLLLYWWRRQQAEEMDYPSLAWLDEDFRKQLERTQQRHWLQVLWRILLIVLLIYTLSQPIIGEGRPTSNEVVVFVDNSMSMVQNNVGESALDASTDWIVNQLGDRVPKEQLRIGAVLPSPRILNPGKRTLEETVRAIEPRPGTASLKLIQDWYRRQSPSERPRIIFVTDSQTSNYNRSTDEDFNRMVEIKTPFSQPDNHTIKDASFEQTPQFVGQESTLNWTTNPGGINPAQITVGEETLFPSGGRARWTPNRTGFHQVTVELPDDSLSWDNTYRLVGHARGTLNILFNGKSRAVNSTKFTLRNRVNPTTNPRSADAVIFGTSKLNLESIDVLSEPEYTDVPKLILTGQEFDRRAFAELDSALDVPWRMEGLVEFDEPYYPNLDDPSWFKGTGTAAELINQLKVHAYYRVQSTQEGQSIVTLNGDPLFAQSGSWYLLTLPPEQYLKPKSASTRWPTLLMRIIRGTVRTPPDSQWQVGNPVQFERDFTFPITVKTPADQEVTINDPGTKWSPKRPGFYRLYGAEGKQSLKAVNYDPAEGDLERPDPSDWPDGLRRYEPREQQINLSLSPWLWLLLMVGLGLDVWMGNRE